MSSCVLVHPEDTRTKDVLCVCFNADASVFAVGTVNGFAVYCADPFVLLVERRIDHGVRHIALFGQSNVLALVPATRVSTVWLWDDTVIDPTSLEEITAPDATVTTVAAGATRMRPRPLPQQQPAKEDDDGAATRDAAPPMSSSTSIWTPPSWL
jgi:hypothetical protein